LPNFAWRPIVPVLLSRWVIAKVTRQVGEPGLTNRHPLSGYRRRTLINRQRRAARRRSEIAGPNPKNRLATERAIHRCLTRVNGPPLRSFVPLVVPVVDELATVGARFVRRHNQDPRAPDAFERVE
jgi:hypothetical protein